MLYYTDIGEYCSELGTDISVITLLLHSYKYLVLSHDVLSGRDITSSIKMDKPLVVYRFSGNVMMFITTLHT